MLRVDLALVREIISLGLRLVVLSTSLHVLAGSFRYSDVSDRKSLRDILMGFAEVLAICRGS